jgi:organic radical activating enzyme
MTGGWLHEIFRSVQGEGIYTGVMQVFVRLSGCGFSCSYCDTEAAKERVESCTCRMPGGAVELENPVNPEAAATLTLSLAAMPGTHSISITGGEPLEQPEFLADFLELARRVCGGDNVFPAYRETLNIAVEKALFCKIVIAGGTDREEFEEAVKLIAEFDAGIPLVIQPATPAGTCIPPDPQVLLDLAALAAPLLEDVRIIPQCHLMLGLP